VKNVDVSGGMIGIHITCTNNSFIQNNSVKNTLSNGLDVSYYVEDSTISDNTVSNAGNVGISPKQSKGGINIVGRAITVSNNTITESGCNGIAYSGDRITIRNNYIDRSCLVLDDCGGIYTVGSDNNIVTGNTVANSIGNFSGTSHKLTQAQGIYLDDFTHNTTVSNNIVSNVDFGIFVHTGHDNTVTGNTVYGARMNGLLINENSTGALPGAVHGNVVTGNVFEALSPDATACYYSTIESATNFGTFGNNRYCHPNSKHVVKNQHVNFTLSAWQRSSGQDLDSTDTKDFCTAPLPTVTFTASPASVESGGHTRLSWASANVISCVAGGAWAGMKAATGSQTVDNVTAIGTYNLTCSGRGGAITKSVTVTVKNLPLVGPNITQ
jgi:parallel beta-helix repeat protein